MRPVMTPVKFIFFLDDGYWKAANSMVDFALARDYCSFVELTGSMRF